MQDGATLYMSHVYVHVHVKLPRKKCHKRKSQLWQPLYRRLVGDSFILHALCMCYV